MDEIPFRDADREAIEAINNADESALAAALEKSGGRLHADTLGYLCRVLNGSHLGPRLVFRRRPGNQSNATDTAVRALLIGREIARLVANGWKTEAAIQKLMTDEKIGETTATNALASWRDWEAGVRDGD